HCLDSCLDPHLGLGSSPVHVQSRKVVQVCLGQILVKIHVHHFDPNWVLVRVCSVTGSLSWSKSRGCGRVLDFYQSLGSMFLVYTLTASGLTPTLGWSRGYVCVLPTSPFLSSLGPSLCSSVFVLHCSSVLILGPVSRCGLGFGSSQ
uniref:Uncharacterized protein n=1 Tax=Cannabis sativa TaxID=3483 RepID=A0A803QRK7_CANSA